MNKSSRLGQNFLKDHKVLERIAEVAEITPKDTVVEIGPGHGELTRRILKYSPGKLIGIEKDEWLTKNFLAKLSEEHPQLEIVVGDALIEIPKIKEGYKLVSNIPYYITGHLLRILQEVDNKPEIIILTIQKEVAERICSEPPKMNLLAASVQFWAKPEIVRYISKKSFKPAPRVDSAVIKISPASNQPAKEDAEKYYKFLKVLFNHPRKTILNNLKPLGCSRETLDNLGLKPKSRPQNLSIEQIKELSTLFTTKVPTERYN